MNIFMLDENASQAAKMHCDKHVVKMIVEYAQLLSTSHRVLDGKQVEGRTQTGRKAKRWVLDDRREDVLYQCTHVNHPSAIWARQSEKNYSWLYSLFVNCCDEYKHRYGKVHATWKKLGMDLASSPEALGYDGFYASCTQMPQAMPDEFKKEDPVEGYRAYYMGAKRDFCKWTKREQPEWFK